MSELHVLVEGATMGRLIEDPHGRLTFQYFGDWLYSQNSFPWSTSMPLVDVPIKHRRVAPFLWNLLPESPGVLQLWGHQYGVSPNNPLRLLTFVGEDLTGAAQLIPPERAHDYLTGQVSSIAWLTLDELDRRILTVKNNAAAMRLPGDVGRMSLAGVQAKTALYFDGARWGVPAGRAATSHILKPVIPGFPGIVENEHLCQDIAARVGLPAARSWVLNLSEPVIVVERYDRLAPQQPGGLLRRVHQEDFCQALGLMPRLKYQQDGGPGMKQCVELVRRVSLAADEDVWRMLQAQMLNWYIGGTDAHAKNYSILIAPEGARLAPLYDVSSQLPYTDQIPQRLAMKVGDKYEVAHIGLDDWKTLANQCKVDEAGLVTRLQQMGQALPDHINDARAQARRDGLNEQIVEPLTALLIEHVHARRMALG
ncbi:MAG: HipA domain-containing protein [Steroidobacteraceae bacterium]